jgi:hypothetical protein
MSRRSRSARLCGFLRLSFAIIDPFSFAASTCNPEPGAAHQRDGGARSFLHLLKATSTTQINAVRSCDWWQLFDCWAKAINVKEDLVEVECIGSEFAAALVGEIFYWSFDNRKQLARYVGRTPSHFQSGPTCHDQGISKAGTTKANDD